MWQKILEIAKFHEGTESEINKYYKDEETFRLVSAMGSVIGIPVEEVWEAYGGFLIQFTMETGWDELLRAMSPDLEGFLDGLDSLHYFIDHVVYRTKLKGPAFRCEAQDDGSLLLHYYSRRSGLYPIVKGVIREVARRIYDTEVVMKVQERKQEHVDSLITEHVIFVINQVESGRSLASLKSTLSAPPETIMSGGPYPVVLQDFCNAFPHHLCFDRELALQHVGAHIHSYYPWIVAGSTRLTDVLDLMHPEIPLSFESMMAFRNSLFVFRLKDFGNDQSSIDPPDNDLVENSRTINGGANTGVGKGPALQLSVTLKGSMHGVGSESNFVVFMCSLNVTTVRELRDRNLFLADIQRHDSTRDLIMLNQSRMSQVELNRKLEETTRNLKKMAKALEAEKQRTEELLCEMMPPSGEYQESTVLFTDIVTFTNICAHCTPYDVVNLLNDLYLRFDRLVGFHDVYKVETIGDAYMIVGGVPKECVNHAEKVLNVSVGMLMESKYVLSPITRQPISIRVGVHSGPVVAGVLGVKMPRYCLFGDTIYVANRMESGGIANKIHVSEPTKLLGHKTNPSFIFTERGRVEVAKNKGPIFTYFLEKNDRKSVWEICNRKRENYQSIDGYSELHSENALPGATVGGMGVQELSSRTSGGNDSTFVPSDGTEGRALPPTAQENKTPPNAKQHVEEMENGGINNTYNDEEEEEFATGRHPGAKAISKACTIL